jgi:hypothetical protein
LVKCRSVDLAGRMLLDQVQQRDARSQQASEIGSGGQSRFS